MKILRTTVSSALAGFVTVTATTLLTGCGSHSEASRASLPTRTVVASSDYSVVIDSARSHLARAVDPGVGLAAAVLAGDELVWLGGAGYASLETETVVDPRTARFRIYSVAKPMTAVAAARLMERGRLDPSAPIARYVPNPPPAAKTVTPIQLATHTAGIRHYRGDEAANLRHCATVSEAISIFRDDPLAHPPGDRETYSSWGYVLLSEVVATGADSPFPEAMNALVFQPTGMTRTVIDDPTRDVEGRASFYHEEAGQPSPAPAVDNTCKWGAGGYVSTAEDVARFGAAMLDDSFLSTGSLELFMRGTDVYRAQGIGVGGAAFLIVDRADSLSVAVLSNALGEAAGPAAQEAADRIHELFRGGP